MPTIPDELVKQVKASTDLAQLIGETVSLKRHGASLHGRCPFHDDKTPSLVVTPSKGLWNCLGKCSTGGDCYTWIMKLKGVDFPEAFRLLHERTGLNGTTRKPRPQPPSLPSGKNDHLHFHTAINHYHTTLTGDAGRPCRDYLAGRGISPEAIDHFQLGFSNRSLGKALPDLTDDEEVARDALARVGILRESGHEHFRGCLVIPIFDGDGRPVEAYGRRIAKRIPKHRPRHLYLKGTHKGVWNRDGLEKEVILCESIIDGLTFWSAGLTSVTSSYGTGGFTRDHLEAFDRLAVKTVYLAYDRDEAGDTAAHKIAKKLAPLGITCLRVHFPKGMDANEYARKMSPPRKALEHCLKNAHPIGPQPAGKEVSEPANASRPQPSQPSSRRHKPSDKPAQPKQLARPQETTLTPEPEAIKGKKENSQAPKTPSSPSLTAKAPDTEAVKEKKAPVPTSPKPDRLPLTEIPGGLEATMGSRRYKIYGLAKNLSYGTMNVTLVAYCGQAVYTDQLNLYKASPKNRFILEAASELGLEPDTVKRDLSRLFGALEERQEANIAATLSPKQPKEVILTDKERTAAVTYLKQPHLIKRITIDFEKYGLVGEEINSAVGYLTAISRRLDEPLAIIIQSSSSAGKSALMDAILAFVPDEEKVKYTAMTGQSLFYMGETDLRHKVIAISEEEGAEKARYAIKTLQSEKKLSIASTGKDPKTGRLETQEYHVEGPVVIIMTTTNVEIDEELENRCIILTINETRAQTEAIHRAQRRKHTLEGKLMSKSRDSLVHLHQNIQRVLRPLEVVNPYADDLTFLSSHLRTRRDHEKYLGIINAITYLHQYQRPVKTRIHEGKTVHYVETTLDDIETANRLCNQILGQSLDDLSPQTRKLLGHLEKLVKEGSKAEEMDPTDYRFTARQVREYTGFSSRQVRRHLDRLIDLEYVLVHPAGRGRRVYYELLYRGEGKDGSTFLLGLIDTEKLRRQEKKKGKK